jgi:hypothetical protein
MLLPGAAAAAPGPFKLRHPAQSLLPGAYRSTAGPVPAHPLLPDGDYKDSDADDKSSKLQQVGRAAAPAALR